MNWYALALSKYATFKGRASRKEYWYFVLFNIIFSILLGLLDEVLGTVYVLQEPQGIFHGLYFLLMIIPSFAVTVRRLHDSGRSGWWIVAGIILFILTTSIAVFASFNYHLNSANTTTDTNQMYAHYYFLGIIFVPHMIYSLMILYFGTNDFITNHAIR